MVLCVFDEDHVVYRYKYLPFTAGSLKALTEGTIKFASPLDFNDPFDCVPHYDTASIEQISKLRPDLYKAAGDRRGLSPAKRLQKKGEFVARLRNRINDGSFGIDLVKNVGIVSLSRNGLNIPMWSHYSDFHRGLLLEFRTPIMGRKEDLALTRDRLMPFPVIYQKDRPHIDIGVENKDELFAKVLLTKSEDWEYEEEERVIDYERGPGIYQYERDDILCSVIAGMNISRRDYKSLVRIVGDLAEASIPNLSLYKAEPVDGEFRLQARGHPRLDLHRKDKDHTCK